MRKLLVLLVFVVSCGGITNRAIDKALEDCKNICGTKEYKTYNVVCFEKGNVKPICMCASE